MLDTTDLFSDYEAHPFCIEEALKILGFYHFFTEEEFESWEEDEELIDSITQKLDEYFDRYTMFLGDGTPYEGEVDWVFEDSSGWSEAFGEKRFDKYGECVAYSQSGLYLCNKHMEVMTDANL